MAFIGAAHDIDLRNATVNNVGGNQYYVTNNYLVEEKALAALKAADRNGYDVPGCIEGTREAVFREIDQWLDCPDVDSIPNIVWISGSPGAGKSAIASTLVSILSKRGRLGAFFFCKRGDANLSDPAALWRTVAYDLSKWCPSVKASVIGFLGRPGFRDADIQLHYECMIQDVLKNSIEELRNAPPVIVIDALDECGSDDSQAVQRQRRILLDTLARWSRLPRVFKLIVTSRDERLPSSFRDEKLCRKITLETGDRVSDETHRDIRVFFEQSLSDIRPDLGLPSTWPGEPSITQLTKRAAGLFIWAKTAMAFIEERRGDPAKKLKLVLTGNLGSRGEEIDTLYQNILYFSFRDSDDSTLALLKMVVGAIIAAKVPLYCDDLKRFLHLLGRYDEAGEREFNAILYRLSSVLEDGPLRIKHLSFSEFLTDPDRCHDRRFLVDREEQERNLALACLRVMNSELRFNICGLESSHCRNDDVADLSSRIAKSIPTRLSYSCRFWAAHLCDTPKDDCDTLLMEIKDFFHIRLLYWLEVMSLVKEIPASSIALLAASRWLHAFDLKLFGLAKDAGRFVANFYTPISESVPHIYLSALPFSPKKSLISQQFLPHFPETLSVVIGGDDHWPALMSVLTGHRDLVKTVAYSPDGTQIVSGSVDKTIRIWDVETGHIVAGPFKGHTGAVLSVAYLPDGKRVVSGSTDKTLRVWNIESGQITAGPFEGHTDDILSVACSPDGKRVISGSSDKTLLAWDVETASVVAGPFTGHVFDVTSVACSPNNKHVASGSLDGTIRVWDIDIGQVVAGPFGGRTFTISAIAYSPDGKRIVSGSSDMMLRVWDIDTGRLVNRPFNGHTNRILSVAYSPDGKRILSGSADETLCEWDVNTGDVVAGPFKGHEGRILSVAYSADGKVVASGSSDMTIRLWDIKTGQVEITPFKSHSAFVKSIAFSLDGKQVFAGSSDGTLRRWDVESGRVTLGPLMAHEGEVSLVAYSPNGERVVSCSPSDGRLRVWDAETGFPVGIPMSHWRVQLVAWSPDGMHVCSCSSMMLKEWNPVTGQALATTLCDFNDYILSLSYSPNGKPITIVLLGKSHYRAFILGLDLWDSGTRQTTGYTFNCDSTAYSPERNHIVSGSFDGTLLVCDIKTVMGSTGPLQGHANKTFSVAHSSDGEKILSGRDTIHWDWDIETGRAMAGPFKGCTGPVDSVAYSLDGKRVASGSHDDQIRVWDVDASRIIAGRPAYSQDSSAAPHVKTGPLDTSNITGDALSTMPVHSIPEHSFSTVQTIGGPAVFGSCRHPYSNGWSCSRLTPSDDILSLIFWVPYHAREGLHDGKSLLVLGDRRTQVDLSRFVHGTSWTHCYSPSKQL